MEYLLLIHSDTKAWDTMTETQRAALLAAHGEIFDVAWWQQLQARLRDGEVVDVPPYPEALRLRPESAPQPV